MKKVWLLVAGLVIALAAVGLTGCNSDGVTYTELPSNLEISLDSQQEGIWVGGTGEVSAVPDIAMLSLGIEAQEASVSEAQSRANEAMSAVMDALTGNGIAEKDIRTQYFNIQKVTNWDKDREEQIVIGYRVTNMVTAKIKEMEKVGAIIDAAVTAGGDLTRVDNISFSIDDPSVYYEEARKQAIADARTKAEQIAELTGINLGKPTYVSESSQGISPIYRQDYYLESGASPSAVTPISPGEMEIILNVQLAYAILD